MDLKDLRKRTRENNNTKKSMLGLLSKVVKWHEDSGVEHMYEQMKRVLVSSKRNLRLFKGGKEEPKE